MLRTPIRVVVWIACLLAVHAHAMAASDHVPDECYIHQNAPDPFCAASFGELTVIRFDVPCLTELRIVVGDPDTIIVMRTLLEGPVPAGSHLVAWDGRDDWGGYMTGGRYPYFIQERDPETGHWLRGRKRVLTIDCTSVAKATTWGRVKSLYRFSGADG